jgi:hypothetical protein
MIQSIKVLNTKVRIIEKFSIIKTYSVHESTKKLLKKFSNQMFLWSNETGDLVRKGAKLSYPNELIPAIHEHIQCHNQTRVVTKLKSSPIVDRESLTKTQSI